MLVVRPIPEERASDISAPTAQAKERPRTLEEKLEIVRKGDPNSFFFEFRGLIVRKFQQKLSVVTAEYNFV